MAEYVAVKDLPQVVQSALISVGYGCKDIQVKVQTSVQLSGAGGSGRRSFAILVDLAANKYHVETGSWGGQNMFDRANPVDNDFSSLPLPGNGAAIIGSQGGGHPVFARLVIPRSMVAKIITADRGPELSPVERVALGCYKSLKSGPYRQEALARAKVTPAMLDSLVARGYLKRSSNGATQITTAGKNLAGDYR
jgi:hypothetical protein